MPGCGKSKLLAQINTANIGIWKDGCLEILKKKLKAEVVPLMFGEYSFQ